ncbi:MAG: hypothetical protein ACI4I9_04630 [Porcipelethomonas sp.]
MKNLSYFMRKTEEKIVDVPAPESFRDENGSRIDMEVRVLSTAQIRKIQDHYRKRTIALDKKGNPIVSNGEVVFKTEYDSNKAMRHILAEALVYPSMKDEELMKYYNCYDMADLPLYVFDNMGDYNYVFGAVMTAIGLSGTNEEDKEKEELDTAKN